MAKCKAKGGSVQKSDSEGTSEEKKEIGDKKSAFKRGGKVKKIAGKKPGMRPDKKSRGGKADMQSTPGVKGAAGMSASSPLSGAGKTAEAKAGKNDKEDD